MTAWWYQLLFLAAVLVLLIAVPWLCDEAERRADDQDRRTWREMGGGRW